MVSPGSAARIGGRLLRPCARLRWTGLTVGVLSVTGAILGSGLVRTQCPFRAVFGIDCPFCGGTRAMLALIHGDVLAAIRWDAFAVLVALPVAVGMLVAGARMELGRGTRLWPGGRLGRAAAVALAIVTVAWTVLRNLPFAPFDALRV